MDISEYQFESRELCVQPAIWQNVVESWKLCFVIATELQYKFDLPSSETIIKIAKRERKRDMKRTHNFYLPIIQ